jgi:hypothetical protein
MAMIQQFCVSHRDVTHTLLSSMEISSIKVMDTLLHLHQVGGMVKYHTRRHKPLQQHIMILASFVVFNFFKTAIDQINDWQKRKRIIPLNSML